MNGELLTRLRDAQGGKVCRWLCNWFGERSVGGYRRRRTTPWFKQCRWHNRGLICLRTRDNKTSNPDVAKLHRYILREELLRRRNHRSYRSGLAAGPLKGVVHGRQIHGARTVCDMAFVDGNGQVVAELIGVETVLRPDAAPATPAQAA